MNYQSPPRPFSWSYSGLTEWETCPKKYAAQKVHKTVKDEGGSENAYGLDVHRSMASRIINGTQLPSDMKQYEHWCRMADGVARTMNVRPLVEQKLGLTKDFAPCEFFDRRKDVWFRGVIDVALVNDGPSAVAIDWKTSKNIKEDPIQLALFAQLIFAHWPHVQWVTTEYVWLKHNTKTTEHFTRGTDGVVLGEDGKNLYVASMAALWLGVLPRVHRLEHAHQTQDFPPQPSGLCRAHCNVASCPYFGKGRY